MKSCRASAMKQRSDCALQQVGRLACQTGCHAACPSSACTPWMWRRLAALAACGCMMPPARHSRVSSARAWWQQAVQRGSEAPFSHTPTPPPPPPRFCVIDVGSSMMLGDSSVAEPHCLSAPSSPRHRSNTSTAFHSALPSAPGSQPDTPRAVGAPPGNSRLSRSVSAVLVEDVAPAAAVAEQQQPADDLQPPLQCLVLAPPLGLSNSAGAEPNVSGHPSTSSAASARPPRPAALAQLDGAALAVRPPTAPAPWETELATRQSSGTEAGSMRSLSIRTRRVPASQPSLRRDGSGEVHAAPPREDCPRARGLQRSPAGADGHARSPALEGVAAELSVESRLDSFNSEEGFGSPVKHKCKLSGRGDLALVCLRARVLAAASPCLPVTWGTVAGVKSVFKLEGLELSSNVRLACVR